MKSAKTAIAVAFAVSLVAACQKSETTTTNSSTKSETTATSSTVSETATALPVTDSSSTVASAAPPATTTTPGKVATTSRTAREPSKTDTTSSASPVRTETAATTTTVTPPASAPSPRQETQPAAPPGPTASSAEGASIFKNGCTVCHGADASGNTPMGKKNNIPDFHSAAVQSQSDAELSRLIAEGKGPVSAAAHKSKHLTPDQVKALLAFIRTLK